jgi:hypothetical protein
MNIHIDSSSVTLAQCVAMLEARRQLLCESLNDFARPIAACDADFNAILAKLAEVVMALFHLQPLCRGEVRIPHPREDH